MVHFYVTREQQVIDLIIAIELSELKENKALMGKIDWMAESKILLFLALWKDCSILTISLVERDFV